MVRLTGKDLSIGQVAAVAAGERVALDPAALARAKRSHRLLQQAAKQRIIYGVNTGFGPMADRLVGAGELAELQQNLVRSHACGAGPLVSDEYVFAAMVVRLNTLLRGDSGVSTSLLRLLAACINARLAPAIPERGGVGASGDLIQLSHIALALIGEGSVSLRGRPMSAAAAFKRLKLRPHVLGPKEGLALINGTSFMTGVAALALCEAEAVVGAALRASALALEAAGAFSDALAPALHAARPHLGQQQVAKELRRLTAGSKLLTTRAVFERRRAPGARTEGLERVAQDVYSLRCVPQLLGPVLETLQEARRMLAIELNSATDNPLVGPKGEMLHGGNFHGEYVAGAMDTLKRAMVKVSMLCERRLNYFLHEKLNGQYPPFLNLGTPGLTLGLQGLQFVATSTAALNQTLGYPASLHSVPSNADNQDLVSMGADAALLCAKVVRNAALVAAIELAALSQALAISARESAASKQGRALLRQIRGVVKPVRVDRPLSGDIQKLAAALSRGEFSLSLERARQSLIT